MTSVYMQVLHNYREVTGFVSGQDLGRIWHQLSDSPSGGVKVPVSIFKEKFPLIWEDINRKHYSVLRSVGGNWERITASIDLIEASNIQHQHRQQSIEAVILRDEVAKELSGLSTTCFADCTTVFFSDGAYKRIDYSLAEVETK
jgi:hypothetical protein